MAKPDPWRGLLAGALAGLAAAAVMNGFQAIAGKLVDTGEGEDSDPATVKAADAVSVATTGEHLPEDHKGPADAVMHYATGLVVGAAYGVLAEYYPKTSTGFGAAYGAATNLLLDDAAVPALGLGAGPLETSASTHAYGVSSHLVYGFALEAARRLVGGRAAG